MQKNSNNLFTCHFSHALLGLVDILNLSAVAFNGLLPSLKDLRHLVITYSNFKLCCFFERPEQVSNHASFVQFLKCNIIIIKTFSFLIFLEE